MVLRIRDKTDTSLTKLAKTFQLEAPPLRPDNHGKRQRHQDHQDRGHQQHLHKCEAAAGMPGRTAPDILPRKTGQLELARL